MRRLRGTLDRATQFTSCDLEDPDGPVRRNLFFEEGKTLLTLSGASLKAPPPGLGITPFGSACRPNPDLKIADGRKSGPA